MTTSKVLGVKVRLVPVDNLLCGELIVDVVRTRKGLAVFRAIKEGYGRPGWTMPIDRKGRPPKQGSWAWRVHDEDISKLPEVG